MDEVIPPLDAVEVRVLGSLIEKAVTTPDYYPLSVGALTNACNQLSNREPVVNYDESDVLLAVDRLREKRLASKYHGAESRVPKYKHAINEVLLLTPAELALLCVLMLRGPQTLGELRSRSDRLFTFAALADVEECLDGLARRQPPLAAKLPRQFGLKESRYTHLLSGPPEPVAEATAPVATDPADTSASRTTAERLAQLEAETASLRQEVDELKQQLAAFRKQFE